MRKTIAYSAIASAAVIFIGLKLERLREITESVDKAGQTALGLGALFLLLLGLTLLAVDFKNGIPQSVLKTNRRRNIQVGTVVVIGLIVVFIWFYI